MVAFAGYELPVHYPAGILAEHRHTREQASLFDVSHMGFVALPERSSARALEALVPADLASLEPGAMRYTQFTNEAGGILDDLMATRGDEGMSLVVNAARKAFDLSHLRARLGVTIEPREDYALLALQGPAAAAALARLAPSVAGLSFMHAARITILGAEAHVSRSGYTGEDGFEIALPGAAGLTVARRLLAEPEVKPAGLGARDSLRLEAGLCLYGHDIDETTTPVEAGLSWSLGKERLQRADFPGARRIREEMERGAKRRRVGLKPEGPALAREGAAIAEASGRELGRVTSGGFGATVGGPIAMGYVETAAAALGTQVSLAIRGRAHPARIVRLPFVPHRYHRR